MNRHLLILLLLLFSVHLNAQTNFGLKAGINSSNHSYQIDGDYVNETNYLIGYQVGIWMSTSLSEKIDLISEISYAKEGFKFDLGDSSSWNTRMSFVSINTTVNYLLSKHFMMGVGPELARNVNSKWIINDEKIDVDKYRKYAYGLNFNFSYKFDMPLIIGFRYYQGFNDIGKSKIIFTDANGNISNEIKIEEIKRNFQINVYYQF